MYSSTPGAEGEYHAQILQAAPTQSGRANKVS